MIVAPTDIWHDKREDIVCFSHLSVKPFLFCQTISLSMLYECLPFTEMHINIHKRFEDVHNKAQNWNGQENPDLRETASIFFLHFVVEKNWMWGVKNTCGGAWEPILFFFWPYIIAMYWYTERKFTEFIIIHMLSCKSKRKQIKQFDSHYWN